MRSRKYALQEISWALTSSQFFYTTLPLLSWREVVKAIEREKRLFFLAFQGPV
jgi:hypothetical protein